MYIIEEGKAYLVDGEVGYLADFDTTGKMTINKDKTIEVQDKTKYSYEEMYARLNIAYRIEEAKKKNASKKSDNEEIIKLNSKIEELLKENNELKSKIKDLESKSAEYAKNIANEALPKEEENTSKENYKKNNK